MDSWCSPTRAPNGVVVSGGAARNVRIAALGGMDEIIDATARDAARNALERANLAVKAKSIAKTKTKLKLVG